MTLLATDSVRTDTPTQPTDLADTPMGGHSVDDTGDDTRRSGEFGHIPVMGRRIVELLTPALESDDRRVFLDATLGAGGHSELILNTFPNVHLVGIDRDASALEIAQRRLEPHADRISLHQATFHEIADVLADAGEESIDAALFDLGVSSMQLDQAGRGGFAYSVDAPLDMRMNSDDPLTAADVLNTYSHGELACVLSEYGEERFAGKIASAVLREREKEPFTTSARLVELLYASIPAATRRTVGTRPSGPSRRCASRSITNSTSCVRHCRRHCRC